MFGKMLVNALTLSRFVLGLLFVYYIMTSPDKIFQIILLYAVICFTDLLDGKLARSLSVTSKSGAFLDVLADLFFIASSCLALIVQGYFPAWMLAVILLKFAEFLATSAIVGEMSNTERILIFDRLGKTVAIIFYTLPPIVLLSEYLLPHSLSILIINSICIPLAIAALVSSLYRIKVLLWEKVLLSRKYEG